MTGAHRSSAAALCALVLLGLVSVVSAGSAVAIGHEDPSQDASGPAIGAPSHPLPYDAVSRHGNYCVGEVRLGSGTTAALVGETITVDARTSMTCAGEGFPLQLVVALDVTGSEATAPEGIKSALHQLVTGLDLSPTYRVGVVPFHQAVPPGCGLTEDPSELHACIDRLTASPGPARIDRGLREALRVLSVARDPLAEGVREAILLVTASANATGEPPVAAVARVARSQDILVSTVCMGEECRGTLQGVASHRHEHYQTTAAGLPFVLRDYKQRRLLPTVWMTSIRAVGALGEGLEFVGFTPAIGSFDYDPATRRFALNWTAGGTEARLGIRVRVRRPGTLRIAEALQATADGDGGELELATTSSYVLGLEPARQPTLTAIP